MGNNKTPTAEELLENYRFEAGEHIGNRDYDLMCSFAIEFAKIHVEEALKAADNNALSEIVDWDDSGFNLTEPATPIYGVGSASILNAYPLSNIK